MTLGWELLVQFKGKTLEWDKSKYTKASNKIEVVEYTRQ